MLKWQKRSFRRWVLKDRSNCEKYISDYNVESNFFLMNRKSKHLPARNGCPSARRVGKDQEPEDID
jgi:hypothetical protein